ncbi:MAG: HNH endonuclease [Pseudomonadota bacterium]
MNDTADLADRRCIYCWGATEDAQFSEEHIWPQSLGGVAGPAHFITRDVCETCNNRCGLWVDAGFTKTFLAFGDALRGAELFLDPDKPGPLPLVYMGIDVEFACASDEVCERWAGPSGEHVYHVHLRDQPKWDAHAGGDILRRRRDPGRVYVYLTSPELYWTLTALISVAARFPRAKRRCLTVLDGDSLSPLILRVDEGELADCEVREIAFIRGRPTGPIQGQFSIQVDATDRFLAKLALGFGHTLLGPKVSGSPYADDLRRMLWPRLGEEDAADRIRGSAGLRGLDDPVLARFLGVEGAWTLSFRAMPDGFVMSLATPGLKLMHIALSDDPSLWPQEAIARFGDGETYVVVPQRGLVVGPIAFADFLAHQLDGPREPRLAELDALKANAARRPPKRPQAGEAT